MKESLQLVNYLDNNSTKIDDINNLVYFKRISSLIKTINIKYKCIIDKQNLNDILYMLHSSDSKKIYFKKTSSLVTLFIPLHLNKYFLFEVFIKYIINDRLKQFEKEKIKNLNEIKHDWNEIYRLINFLSIKSIDTSLINKLNVYIETLNLNNIKLDDLELNKEDKSILNSITLINKLAVKNDKFYNLIRNNFRSIDFLPQKLVFHDENIQDLNYKINDLETKNKDEIPSKIRLLIKLCNKPNEYQGDVLEKLNQFEEQIPVNRLTPYACQELMFFHSTHTKDLSKSVFYFNLISTNNLASNEFKVDKMRILQFIQLLFITNMKTKRIMHFIASLKKMVYLQSNAEFDSTFECLLTDIIFKKTTHNQFKTLIEILIQANFIDRNLLVTKLVIVKFLEENKFKECLEYFNWNLETNKLCVLEVLLTKYFLEDLNSNQNEFKQFLGKLALTFDWDHVHNCLFLACILKGDYNQAELIYENDLNKKFDFGFLKKFNEELNGKILNRQRQYISNILNFKPFKDDISLKKEIENIINKNE